MTATFLGWFLGIVMILVVASTFDFIGLDGFQFSIGVGMGGGVGFLQWRALKKAIDMNINWIWASLLGLGFPFLINDIISIYFEKPLGSFFLPLCVGTGAVLISVLQFRILKKFSSRAHLWIPGCFAGWTMASLTVMSIDYVKLVIQGNWILFSINITLILGGGVVRGWITGKFLVKILNSRKDNVPIEEAALTK